MAQSCDRIVDGLRKAGYSIEVIHFTSQKQPLVRVQQQGGGRTPVYYYESEAHTLNVTWTYLKTLGDFDYIVAFGGYLAMIGAPIFKKWLDIELITFLRGNDFDTSIFTPRKRETLEYALKESKIVFSVSREKAWKVNQWLSEVEVHFVPNGIAISDWEPAPGELDFAQQWKQERSGKLTLGFMGQLKAKKGIDFFLEAFSKTNLKEQFHFLFIGDIDPDLLEVLTQDEIHFTHLAFLDRYELMKHYLCCDAVMIPSFYEGMPNVMLEAGALGIPVIASAVDGMKDLLEHNKDGLLFQAGDLDACRRVLYDFAAHESREELGKALQQKIRNQYTSEHETEEYIKHLQ